METRWRLVNCQEALRKSFLLKAPAQASIFFSTSFAIYPPLNPLFSGTKDCLFLKYSDAYQPRIKIVKIKFLNLLKQKNRRFKSSKILLPLWQETFFLSIPVHKFCSFIEPVVTNSSRLRSLWLKLSNHKFWWKFTRPFNAYISKAILFLPIKTWLNKFLPQNLVKIGRKILISRWTKNLCFSWNSFCEVRKRKDEQEKRFLKNSEAI